MCWFYQININQSVKSKKKGKDQESIQYQAPHLTQDTNGKMTTSQLDIKNESQEVSPFPAGDHKASINRSRETDAHESITKTRQE